MPGWVIHHAANTFRGYGKTDTKDAPFIANQARIRTNLLLVREPDRASVYLHLLPARRLGLIHDRVRTINCLRSTLLEHFPALEAAFDYFKHNAAPTILTTYATPPACMWRSRP